jgi:hypothetical protein
MPEGSARYLFIAVGFESVVETTITVIVIGKVLILLF